MEGMIQGMQHVKAYSTIYALRGVYMGVVNYFAILYFEGGIFGEAVASATRNTFTLCMCIDFLRTHPDAKRFDPRTVQPTKKQWEEFLTAGGWLMAMGVVGHLSKFVQPMLTSRLPEEEAELDHLGFNEEDAAWSELAMGNWPGAEGEFGGGMDGSSAFPI